MRQLISLPCFCIIKGKRDAVHKNFCDRLNIYKLHVAYFPLWFLLSEAAIQRCILEKVF